MVGRGLGVDGQPSFPLGEAPVAVIGVVAPLPLQSQLCAVEVVGGLWQHRQGIAAHGRLCPYADGFADAVAVDVDAHQRPVVAPPCGLQVDDASEHGGVLEVEEPPVAVRRVDEGTLMGSVDRCGALFEHHTLLVGSVDVFRPQDGLPASADAALWDDQIVVAVALEPFRAFCHGSGIYRHAVVEQPSAVGRHPVDDDRSCSPLATAEICLTVIVPEWTGVFPFLHGLHAVERCPRSAHVFCRRHEEALVGRTHIDVEASVVPADARCPWSSGIVAVGVPSRQVEASEDLGSDLPVHHVVGLQHLHAQEVEVAGHHVVLASHADDVGVGVVGVEHRVLIRAVALVTPVEGCLCADTRRAQCQQDGNYYSHLLQKELIVNDYYAIVNLLFEKGLLKKIPITIPLQNLHLLNSNLVELY